MNSFVIVSGAVAINAIFDIPAILVEKFGMAPKNAEFWANVAGIWAIGIIAGTFSSLFIAPSLLVIWEKKEWKRFLSWLPLSRSDG